MRIPSASSRLRRLGLWPRLAIGVTAGFVVLYAVFSVLALRAVSQSTERILEERLVIAQMAARTIDGVLERGFHELEKATEFAEFDPRSRSLDAEEHLLAHAYSRVATFALGVYFLDRRGRVIMTEPAGALVPGSDLSRQPYVREALATGERRVSSPFRDPDSGRAEVALARPIRNPDGSVRSLLVGLVDAAGPELVSPLEQARELGRTGHAELVDDEGIVVASTERHEALRRGEHLGYFLRMLRAGESGVENVAFDPGAPVPAERRGEHHVMAFAPLRAASWGVAVGGLDEETFAAVDRLRRDLLLAGALALGGLWLLTLLGARRLVRPVLTLTAASQAMAAGDLEHEVRVVEGGEVGALAESLDAMRVELRRSRDRLEESVRERTAELATRNRQLAAVAAVATAANQASDLEQTLGRCLDAVLAETGMEVGAVRLVDERGELGPPVLRGDASRLPCARERVPVGACLCGRAASGGAPVYVDARSRREPGGVCDVPAGDAVACLPLRTPAEMLGVLVLARAGAGEPGDEERLTLAAVANQIAVGIENARLLEGLRRAEAQREMQRLRGELLSAVSHELRSPLGVIKGYATTLLREDAPMDAETRREFLSVIDEETVKLGRMVDELLDVSRLKAGRLTVEQEVVDVCTLVARAAASAPRPVSLSLPSSPLLVLADAGRTEQVLRNLLENAVRYSADDTPIELRVAREDAHAIVSVSDRGDGIPEAEQHAIFEPFQRGSSSRARGVAGVGLGLAICRGIVDAQGGTIWVESAVGAGSTFSFTVPLAGEEPA